MSATSAIIDNDEWDGVDRRRAERKLVRQTVLLSLPGQITYQPCALRDLTALGAGLNLEGFYIAADGIHAVIRQVSNIVFLPFGLAQRRSGRY